MGCITGVSPRVSTYHHYKSLKVQKTHKKQFNLLNNTLIGYFFCYDIQYINN